jgi:choline kinase
LRSRTSCSSWCTCPPSLFGADRTLNSHSDFEYAALNPRGFDIANHLIEWTADYHSADSHALTGAYPTLQERRRFYRAYIGNDSGDDAQAARNVPEADEDPRVLRLEDEVRVWSPASHAMWATWALVQARDQVEARIEAWEAGRPPARRLRTDDGVERPVLERGKSGEGEAGDADFDYLLYAKGRVEAFRRSLAEMGV